MSSAGDSRAAAAGVVRQFAENAAVLAIGMALMVAGCGEVDHGNRISLSGTVTIKQQAPDVKGTIFFDPTGGEGTGTSAEVSPEGQFEVSDETGPTPGQKYNVTFTTAPGIPADNTPRDQIKISQTYRTVVDVPARGDDDVELKIDFEAPERR
jgi:hypothetical protein